MLKRKITGIISGGLMGSDPFDPSSWSGSSLSFFNELQKQGLLDNAYGAEISRLEFYLRLLPKYHPVREVWKRRVYMSNSYRNALTSQLAKVVPPLTNNNIVLQLGAYINARDIYGPDATIASYQDGNVAEKFKSDFTHPALLKDKKLYNQVFNYEKKVAQDMNIIFTTSEYLRQSFIEDYNIPQDKVVNVKIGINLPEFEDVLIKPKDYTRHEILFIGKSEFVRKGGDLLLKAFAQIRLQFPDAKLHMVGIDEAPSKEFDQPNVIYHGLLDKAKPEDLAIFKRLLTVCSVFSLPSRFEPLGIAPIEAMLHRIPAIVTGQWALKENILDGVTGLHCEYNNVNDLADKISMLFKNPKLCAKLGNQAREWSKQGFAWKDTVNRITKALSELNS